MHPVILLLLSSITTDWVWLLIFLDHTQQRATVGRTPLNERSVRRWDLYLTTHDNHNKHPCPPTCWGFLFALKNPTASAGFEPANFGTKGQHATSRPPKPLAWRWRQKFPLKQRLLCTRQHDVTSQKTLSSNYAKISCIGQIGLKMKNGLWKYCC